MASRAEGPNQPDGELLSTLVESGELRKRDQWSRSFLNMVFTSGCRNAMAPACVFMGQSSIALRGRPTIAGCIVSYDWLWRRFI